MSQQHDAAKVKHSETESRGVFRIGNFAKMIYTRPSADVMKVDHTLVDKDYRDQGNAQRLYAAMVDFARQQQRKVIPKCPFVAAMFDRFPDDSDVLASGIS